MKKKLSALLIAVALLAGTMPVPALAATGSVELYNEYRESTFYPAEKGKTYITLSGIDTAKEPSTFTTTFTDYDGSAATRETPIYPAAGSALVTLTDDLNWFSVTKMVKLESGEWSFDGEQLPIVGTAVYITREETPAPPPEPDNDGYDNSALTGNYTEIEHVIDASEVTEDLQLNGCEYQAGCTVTITEPGLYCIYGRIGPVETFTEGFVRITEAGPAIPQHTPGGYFPDSWARSEVNAARASGLVPDYWYGSYDCRANVTREDFCELAAKLYCLSSNMPLGMWAAGPGPLDEPSFSDAPYQTEIELMSWLKVVDGDGAGSFNPTGELTREQAAKILTLLYNVVKPGAYDANHDYWAGRTVADSAAVSAWAKNYVGFVMENGIMSGVGNDKFDPQGKYTVQQALLTMYRLSGRTDLWAAPADGALTVYDLGISRSVYGGSIEYAALSGSEVANMSCTGVKVAEKPVEFSGSYGQYSAGTLPISCDTSIDTVTRYEVSLTVTMADGTLYELVDTFQYISDQTGGA